VVADADHQFVMVADERLRHMMPSGFGSRREPINMSLLVIYLWLALVAIMIFITVVIFKYKHPVRLCCLYLYISLSSLMFPQKPTTQWAIALV